MSLHHLFPLSFTPGYLRLRPTIQEQKTQAQYLDKKIAEEWFQQFSIIRDLLSSDIRHRILD
jgi:hypothetical protein